MSVTGSCHFGIRIHSVPNIQWILFARIVSRFWEFWAIDTHLKSRLQLNHVPVHKTHKTHSVKVIKMITKSNRHSLTRVDTLNSRPGEGPAAHHPRGHPGLGEVPCHSPVHQACGSGSGFRV